MSNSQLPLVSVLFITWKRFDLLKPTVESFLRNTDYPNLELVIADDGSPAETQALIRTLPAHVFALAPKNRGLGANNNNGLRHCTGKYILMIQDDCRCQGPADYLKKTILVMESNPQVGIINYYGAAHPLDRRSPLEGSDEACYRMLERPKEGKREHFLYTDQPHVVSREALDAVGYYMEDRDLEECEKEYARRWRDQTRFSTAMFPAYYNRLFLHVGAEQSFRTNRFRYRVQRPLLPLARWLKQRCRPVYQFGHWTMNAGIRALERLRLVR
jgi:glycosyltransferase involved in cell wall biosynthesis